MEWCDMHVFVASCVAILTIFSKMSDTARNGKVAEVKPLIDSLLNIASVNGAKNGFRTQILARRGAPLAKKSSSQRVPDFGNFVGQARLAARQDLNAG